jgi:glycosyl transferase family 25
MRTYVINLERSTDRRQHVEAELAKAGLDYEIVRAVDGRQLDVSGPQVTRPGDPGQRCSPLWVETWSLPGVAACSLSHLLVCERILASGADEALVLEDDVTLAPDLASVLESLPSHLAGAEVVLLNFDSHGVSQLSSQGTESVSGRWTLALPLDVGEILSAAAYVITREACRRMLEQMTPARAKPDDWAYFYRERVIDRLRCVVPRQVEKSAQFTSTILYDPGSIKARLRAVVLAHRIPLVDQAIEWRRRRIFVHGASYRLFDVPFVEMPSRVEDGTP